MSDPLDRAPALIDRLFALLLECRAVLRELKPGQPRQESPSAEVEHLMYYALAGAMEEGLVQTAEHVLTVLRQAHAPLGPMGEEWLRRQERDR
jgi:hypothetical protein